MIRVLLVMFFAIAATQLSFKLIDQVSASQAQKIETLKALDK